MGEDENILKPYDGKYHDMKGRVKMTFHANREDIEIVLSSVKADKPENALHFGAITVCVDDKICEIFSRYSKELEKEPRIKKVINSAKSFVQARSGEKGGLPSTVVEDVSVFRCSQCGKERGK